MPSEKKHSDLAIESVMAMLIGERKRVSDFVGKCSEYRTDRLYEYSCDVADILDELIEKLYEEVNKEE